MITMPHTARELVEKSGIAAQEMRSWMQQVTQAIEDLNFIDGNGSPEGVVYAKPKKQYFNLTGSAGTLVYIKTTPETSNTGWVAIG